MWGVVMTKGSLGWFRFIFFTFTLLLALFAALIAWLVYKFYPMMNLRKSGKPTETLPPGS